MRTHKKTKLTSFPGDQTLSALLYITMTAKQKKIKKQINLVSGVGNNCGIVSQ